MGCACSNRAARVYNTSYKGVKQSEEVDKLADLPLIANEEELDLVSIVEVTVRCSGLPAVDRFSVINPIAYLLLEEEGTFKFTDHTEVQNNTVTPSFITAFNISYSFEKPLRFKIDIYDHKLITNSPPNRNALIGTAVFNIHEVVCAPSHTLSRELLNPISKRKFNGTMQVHSEEVQASKNEVEMKWGLVGANNRDSYVLRLSRSADNDFIPVYQSESVRFDSKETTHWNIVSISISKICNGDKDKQIFAEVFRATNGLKNFGNCFFSLNAANTCALELNLHSSESESERGMLKLMSFRYIEKFSFLDYILGGCEISMIVGIDFTKSNKNPDQEDSLHYQSTDKPNEYVSAITEVGNTLQYYDSNKKIPAFGFGAKLPPSHEVVSHCFALNGNIFEPDNDGIPGLIEKYKESVRSVHFHGPTLFSDIIRTTIQYASSKKLTQDSQQYYILLILTDGIINDLEQTIDEIAVASSLPISIVIVGVGSEDFSMMKILDADGAPLFSKKYNMAITRDLVQFVPYKEFKGKAHALAREVLFEIPNQFTQFMKNRDILPNTANKGIGAQTLHSKQNTTQILLPSVSILNDKKQELIEDIAKMGYSRRAVEEVLEKGIWCRDPKHVIDLLEENKARVKTAPKSILKPIYRKSNTMKAKEPRHNKFCYVCQLNTINIILMDCGCEVVCSKCFKTIGRNCPLCKSPIIQFQSKLA